MDLGEYSILNFQHQFGSTLLHIIDTVNVVLGIFFAT